MSVRWFVLVLAIGLAACGEVTSASDARVDAPRCAAPDTFAIGSIDGHAEPLRAAAGEARAGRVTASDLPPDPAGLATWAAGDYVLASDRFALVISQPERYEVYDPHGGRVRGIARVERGELVDPADFNVAILGLGRFVVATDSVTILSDGSDGGAAIIRAAGPLAPIEALDDLLDALFPGELGGLPAALDYVLEPGSDAIEVRLSMRTASSTARVQFGTAAFFQSFRMPIWSETTAFAGAARTQAYVIFEDPDATSYAWVAPETRESTPGILTSLLSMGGFDFLMSPASAVPPCTEQTFVLGRLAIGEGVGMNGVQRVLARELAIDTRRVQGTLSSDDPAAIAGARVHVIGREDRHLTRALVGADGRFDLEVPLDAAQVFVWREGAPLEGPFAIPASGPMTIPLAPLATIRVEVRDSATAASLPARVQLFPASGAPPEAPEGYGERALGRGRSRLEFAGASGRLEMRVAPGAYRLVVSRGWEMERHDERLDLAAGEIIEVSANLVRAFETPGVMCADYHIHTHRSVDSQDTALYKVSALVADGLEIAIRSEHEWVSDFQPVLDTLGLGDFAIGLAGEELTTFTYGHFGVFPLEPDPSRPSAGAIAWYGRRAPDLFDEVRARPESPLLIINHPRANGIRQGYFRETGYDRATGMVAHPENWDERFDVLEVLNSGDFDRFRDDTVEDWFSLLRAGRRVMMVGSSDSHRVTLDPVGYPRTCLAIGEDDPRMLSPELVRDVTRSGASFVTGGIYLEITGPNGIGPGGEASGVGSRASIDVVVRAASFLDVDRLEVFVDGTLAETIAIRAEDADPIDPTIRLRARIEVEVAASGSFVVLHASGTDEPDIAYGGRPFAASNPLFLRR